MPIDFSPRQREIPEYEGFETFEENIRNNRMKSRTMAAAVIIGVLVSGADGFPAEKFQKLGGSQIRAKFTGMEMTDNVHWADVFGQNGSLKSYSMGRKKDGKWWIAKDELCVDRGKD